MGDDAGIRQPEAAGRPGATERAAVLIAQHLSRVEDEIRTARLEQWGEFRWLLGTLIGGIVVILGTMAYGFRWL